ncbi:hypothetical protein CEXT_119861 [Caerostris extrusa]|uniref:Uncharacterized protein n=1 Tax=Caerostris extrusa TaxID=172846 RepID=A0AAV4U556_CAEEX|nr:hypothetical protein CEXT_119861 [Caerostris extrusa]
MIVERFVSQKDKGSRVLTGGEEDDGLQTAVLRRIHMQCLQLLHLLLEDADVVHEGDHPVGGHGTGVQPRGGKQGRHVEGHRALGGIQHEQLAPDKPQQRHLVGHLKVRKERDVPGPLHRTEEQPCGQLADVVDAHNVAGLHALRVPRGRVGFRPQQQRDEAGQVGVTVESVAIGQGYLSGEVVLGGGTRPRCTAVGQRKHLVVVPLWHRGQK